MHDAAPGPADLHALALRLADRCRATGARIAAAESCTGGLVGHSCTEVPGASAWFAGGVIAYANTVKAGILGVPAETLQIHGAVSAQTAVAMAAGARRVLGTDIAVAVTGIAGPDGGSPAKPVGLTHVAVADEAGHDVRRFVWPHDRSGVKRASAAAALEMLLDRLSAR